MEAWKRGAEVYKNAGCSGKTDLVLAIDGKMLEVDVKCMSHNGGGKYGTCSSISAAQKPVVLVHPITQQIRWIRGKAPKGWENFWD